MTPKLVNAVTREQIAQALRVNPQTVWVWTKRPGFPQPVTIGGLNNRTRYYSLEDAAYWLRTAGKARPSQLHALRDLAQGVEV